MNNLAKKNSGVLEVVLEELEDQVFNTLSLDNVLQQQHMSISRDFVILFLVYKDYLVIRAG